MDGSSGRAPFGATARSGPEGGEPMPTADFFGRLGLFVVKEFLDAELRARLRLEMRSASSTPATISRAKGDVVIESMRHTNSTHVSAEAEALLEARLLTLKPRLEKHFNLPLRGWQTLQFLHYQPGGFYRPHRDNSGRPNARMITKQRQVSVVLFLNGEAEEERSDTYSGGALKFYGLLDDARAKGYGFPLKGEAGLLTAFRSTLMHEVTPVTRGERYTIVTWFF